VHSTFGYQNTLDVASCKSSCGCGSSMSTGFALWHYQTTTTMRIETTITTTTTQRAFWSLVARLGGASFNNELRHVPLTANEHRMPLTLLQSSKSPTLLSPRNPLSTVPLNQLTTPKCNESIMLRTRNYINVQKVEYSNK